MWPWDNWVAFAANAIIVLGFVLAWVKYARSAADKYVDSRVEKAVQLLMAKKGDTIDSNAAAVKELTEDKARLEQQKAELEQKVANLETQVQLLRDEIEHLENLLRKLTPKHAL